MTLDLVADQAARIVLGAGVLVVLVRGDADLTRTANVDRRVLELRLDRHVVLALERIAVARALHRVAGEVQRVRARRLGGVAVGALAGGHEQRGRLHHVEEERPELIDHALLAHRLERAPTDDLVLGEMIRGIGGGGVAVIHVRRSAEPLRAFEVDGRASIAIDEADARLGALAARLDPVAQEAAGGG
jgi:hypothetical protein